MYSSCRIGDLACQGDVRALARQVCQGHDRLDVVIHNAGAVNTTRRVTVDGVEATLAINHLAPFLLRHTCSAPPNLKEREGAAVSPPGS